MLSKSANRNCLSTIAYAIASLIYFTFDVLGKKERHNKDNFEKENAEIPYLTTKHKTACFLKNAASCPNTYQEKIKVQALHL